MAAAPRQQQGSVCEATMAAAPRQQHGSVCEATMAAAPRQQQGSVCDATMAAALQQQQQGSVCDATMAAALQQQQQIPPPCAELSNSSSQTCDGSVPMASKDVQADGREASAAGPLDWIPLQVSDCQGRGAGPLDWTLLKKGDQGIGAFWTGCVPQQVHELVYAGCWLNYRRPSRLSQAAGGSPGGAGGRDEDLDRRQSLSPQSLIISPLRAPRHACTWGGGGGPSRQTRSMHVHVILPRGSAAAQAVAAYAGTCR